MISPQTIVITGERVADMQQTISDADERARNLSARVASGDEAAFRDLHDEYSPRIRRFVLALARGDELLASEITQATLLTAAGKLRRVEGEEHLWNWLARVARQHLGKVWRKQKREAVLLPLEAVTEIAAESEADRILETALDAAVQTLEPDEQSLLRLFYDERISQNEIAARLDLTAKAVAGRLDRLREKLRRKISERLRT